MRLGADRVREVAYGADGLASCELARLEFASILKRHVREHHVTRREMTAILKDFEEDEKNGVWQWFGVTSELLEKARNAVLEIPNTVFLRSGDALHLACAEEHGFQEVYAHGLQDLAALPGNRFEALKGDRNGPVQHPDQCPMADLLRVAR